MTKRKYYLSESKRLKPTQDVNKGSKYEKMSHEDRVKLIRSKIKQKKKLSESDGMDPETMSGDKLDKVLTSKEKEQIRKLAKNHFKRKDKEQVAEELLVRDMRYIYDNLIEHEDEESVDEFLTEIFGLSKREKAAKWFGAQEKRHHSAGKTVSINAHKDFNANAHEIAMNHHWKMWQQYGQSAEMEKDPRRRDMLTDLKKMHIDDWKKMDEHPGYVAFKNSMNKASKHYNRANKAARAVRNLQNKKHPFAEQVEELEEVKKVKLVPGQKMTSKQFKAAKKAVLEKKPVKPSKAVTATAKRMSGSGLNKKPAANADDENQSYLARLLKGDLGHSQLSNMTTKAVLAKVRRMKPNEQEKFIPTLFDPKTGHDTVVRLLKQ